MSNEYDKDKIKKKLDQLNDECFLVFCPSCGSIDSRVFIKKNKKCQLCKSKDKKDKWRIKSYLLSWIFIYER